MHITLNNLKNPNTKKINKYILKIKYLMLKLKLIFSFITIYILNFRFTFHYNFTQFIIKVHQIYKKALYIINMLTFKIISTKTKLE